MSDNSFDIKLQAVLDKIKSIAKIKADIKGIESKLPRIKLQGTLNKTAVKKELDIKLKTVNPKVKIDADTTQAEKKIEKIGKQKTDPTITPKVDNTQAVSGLKQAQKETKTLWEKFTSGIMGINLIQIGIQKVVQAIHQAISGIKELDAIKTNIQMISGTSDSGVNAMLSSYNAMAKDLSSTTKDVAEAANEFLRMGESIASTRELIKSSQVLSKVGIIESGESSSYLISSLKGYKIAAENSMDVVSKLTSVDLEAAVSAGGLAEALSKCADIANNSGVSMDRLIGYTATVGETTQKSMSEVGNSFQSLLSRMNNIKIGRFIDDETGESLSDTESVLNKLGIQLRDTENAYRSFDAVLDDIGSRWKDFTKVEQNAISVAIAGTRQRENFEALMDNYGNALKYSEMAANSAGSALERYGVYQDSLEAKTNELTAAIESLSMSTISEGLYGGIMEATTGLVEFIDKTNLLKGTLAGFVAMGVSKAIVSIGTGFITAARSTAQLSAAMALLDKGRSVDNLKNIGAACKGLSDHQLKLILSTKGLKYEDRALILAGMGVKEAEQKQTLATLGFSAAEDKATASTFSLRGAFKALGTAISTNPIGAIVTAVSAAVIAFSSYNDEIEETRQKAEDFGNEIQSTKSEIEDYKNQIGELQKVINDSSSSFDEVSQARKNLMNVQDELIKKFGTEKDTIEIITEAINDQSNALDLLTKKQYQQWKNEFNNKSFRQSAVDFFASDNIANAFYKLTELDFSGAWDMLTAPTESNTDKMVNSMRYAYYKMEKSGNDALDSLIARTYNLQDTGSDFVLKGNLDDIYEDLLGIQEMAKDFDVSDRFESNMTKTANTMNQALHSYKEAYNTFILYEKILESSEDNQYDEQFDRINKAKETYDHALVSGDSDKIKEASDEYAQTLQSAIDLAMQNSDSDVAHYFQSMYPELQQMFGEWQFHINFEANTNGLQDKVSNALDSMDGVSDGIASFSVEDIKNFNPNIAIQDQMDAYGELTNAAESYGLTMKQFLALLQALGLVQSESYQQLVDTFGQEYVDKLSPEDLQIAYTIENAGNMTFEELQTEIQRTKEITEEPASLSITQTIDQLSTQLKPAFDALKSAYQDVFTEDGFTLENVDLSMLDSIKSKLNELNENEELGIRIDYSSFENLAKVLTDTSSESGDVQKAFDSFATSVLNSTGVMDSMDESTVQLVASMLESMGVANANEAAYEALNAKMEGLALQEQFLAETGKELADVTADDAAEFLNHAGASEIARAYLFQLAAAEQAFNAQGLDASGKIEKLKELATAYGQTAIAAKIAHMEDQNAKSHTSFTDSDYQMLVDEVNSAVNTVQVDFGNIGGGSKSAGNAGKEAADAYLEAFEKELKDLDDLKDRGKTSEKQYLDALRRLYLKYFNQKKKYLKEYEKYEHQYLDGMKSLYESAFRYIMKQIEQRIDALGNEKDAAVSALEAERDARLEAIEAEKEQYENEIGGIEKQIDAKEKEIKAMQDANAERKRAIDLQKAEYELQRMQNQKTSLVYKDGQMSYEADASGIRDAKQDVEDKKLETDISKIEKEIRLLEEEKDLLQEQIDLLDKEADRINEYYDKLIADTEKHYDAMIKGLEDYKAQFEELTELLETAQMEATLSELGIHMDALLSGSQEEFEKLKTAYTGILADMNRGNDGVLDQLSRLSGISAESVSYLDATRGALEGLGGVTLEGLEESVDGIGESVSTLSTSAGEASAAVGNIQTGVNTASQSIEPLNQELESLKTLIGELIELLNSIQFPEISDEGYVQKLMDTAQAFGEIASKCAAFQSIDFSSIIGSASASGTDGAAMPVGEGAEGQTGTGFLGLASAISEAATTIDEQMDRLKKALDIGNDAFTEQIRIIHEEYIPAWEELQTRLAEIIGVGGNGDNKEGKGKQKPRNKSENSESGGNGGSIIDIMQTGGEEVAARLEDPWLKAFHDFATDGDNSIQSICDKIIGLVTEMARIIQERCEAAASSLRSLAETAASSLSAASGSGSVSGNTVSGSTIPVFPKAEGTVGKAFAKGTGKYKGLPHHEKYALRSEYGQPELTVYPDGKAELTTEPVMGDLPKGTVIFNEEQTKRIMKNKGEVIGNAYDDGTIILPDGTKARPLNPSDELYWMQKKFESYFKENKDAFLRPANAMCKAAESMDRAADVINNNNNIMNQNVISIGDIHLHEVQDTDTLSKEILLRLPNKLLQEMHKI